MEINCEKCGKLFEPRENNPITICEKCYNGLGKEFCPCCGRKLEEEPAVCAVTSVCKIIIDKDSCNPKDCPYYEAH
jgi:hypothetical protein